LSLKCTVFEIFDFKNAVTLKTGLGVRVNVNGNVTVRYSAYDFLLTFYSNYGFYLVSFLRYSMSKNVVILKFGSKVTEGH